MGTTEGPEIVVGVFFFPVISIVSIFRSPAVTMCIIHHFSFSSGSELNAGAPQNNC